MRIGQTIYEEIAKRAEQGRRVVLVALPPALYDEWLEEGHNLASMLKQIGVEVRRHEGDEVTFFEGKAK